MGGELDEPGNKGFPVESKCTNVCIAIRLKNEMLLVIEADKNACYT